MAENESIGGVVVTIGGDFSPLLADAKNAQGAAAAAGQQIGSAIASGATQASGATNEFSAAIQQLTQSIAEQNAVLSLSIQRNLAHASAIRESGSASHSAVTEIQAVGGGIRTAFGEQSIRAVERFLTMIPGVGVAMQAAFPIIGALALYETISRVIGKTDELKSAMDELKSATKEADKAMSDFVRTQDNLMTHAAGRDFGPAAGAQEKANQLRREALDINNEIADLRSQINTAPQRYAAQHPLRAPLSSDDIKSWNPPEVVAERAALNKKIDALLDQQSAKFSESASAVADAGKLRQQQSGAQSAAIVASRERELSSTGEMARKVADIQINAAHAAAEAQIKAIVDPGNREIAAAEESIRTARERETQITSILEQELPKRIALIRQQGAAEAQGRTPPEQAKIREATKGKVGAAEDAAAKEAFDAHAKTVAAENNLDEAQATAQRGWAEEVGKAYYSSWEKVKKLKNETFAQDAMDDIYREEAARRVAEIEAKGGGQTRALALEGQKIALQGQYAAQLRHTYEQEIAYIQQLSDLSRQQNQVKIDGLRIELANAQEQVAITGDTEKQVAAKARVAEIQQQINELQQQGANQQAQDQNRINTTRAQNDPVAQLKSMVAEWGNLKNEMNQGALQIVSALDEIPQTFAQAIVQGQNLGRTFATLGKQLAASLLTDVLKAGLSAVLHQMMALIPAFGAVGAAQKAAAASTAAAQKVSAEASVMTAAGEAAAWAFESVMAALPFPVNVATAPEVAATTLAQVMTIGQFASGTDSAPGGLAIVGEKGPELMNVPRGSQIIPNHKLKGYADGVGLSSIASSGGSGDIHVGGVTINGAGVSDPRKHAEMVARELPRVLKQYSNRGVAYSH